MKKVDVKLFPAPRSVTLRGEAAALGDAAWIVLPRGCSRRLRERALDVAGRLSRLLNRPLHVSAARPEQGGVLLEMRTGVARHAEQGYELLVEDGRRLLSSGAESGAFYGLLAFAQLVEQFGGSLPALVVTDAPDFRVRGVMLDVSRCKVPTMQTFKQVIDQLAGLRINQLQLYIEHTFAFSAHRAVWHDASPLTHEEILELDQYCADRFVELVPNLNSFGHVERWLRHPEYRPLGECPDQESCSTLAPTAASLRFLEGLYDEFLPHFSSTQFNVGCDETWELGKGRSRKRAEAVGSTAVYLDFLKKIHALCKKKGRTMQFWGDIILHQPALIRELPRDIVALNWGYEGDHPYDRQCPAFADAGIEFHVCPGTSAWNSLCGRTQNCLANLENAARNGLRHGATGMLVTDWGDGGHHQVLPVSYLGFAAGAAYGWHLDTNRDADMAAAVSRHFVDDPTGTIGRVLQDLGRTPERLPGLRRGNCSALHQMLFTKPERLDLTKVSKSQFDRAEAWLGGLEGALPAARPRCADRTQVLDELRHALAISRHALHRGRRIQSGQGAEDGLRRELQDLVMSHEEQWLARNRRGGLHESSTRLRQTALPGG